MILPGTSKAAMKLRDGQQVAAASVRGSASHGANFLREDAEELQVRRVYPHDLP
jgi:hypothetical protein